MKHGEVGRDIALWIHKRPLQVWYLLPFLAITCASIASFWLHRGSNLSAYFVTDWSNTGMDYFNMLAAVMDGNPYDNYANWPPLCFLVLRFLAHFVPYSDSVDCSNGFALRDYMPASLTYIALNVVCLLVIAIASMHILRNKSEGIRYAVVTSIAFSGPVLFSLERGNIVLLSFAFLMLFVVMYESDSFSIRCIGYACLGIAIALKIYPAVFAFMVLFGNYKREFWLVVAMGLLFSVVPFFAFGGLYAVKHMLKGLMMSSDYYFGVGINYSFSNLVCIAGALMGNKIVNTSVVLSALPLLMISFPLVYCKRKWEKLFLLGLMSVWVPSFSYTYSLLFLLPAVLCLCAEGSERSSWDKGALVLLALIFAIYALPELGLVAQVLGETKNPLMGGCVMANVALVAMYVGCFVAAVRQFSARGARRRVSNPKHAV